MKRALVLALNPSIDAEWRVDDVLWEEKNDVRSERHWAGGKGINVARWLNHLGTDVELLLPLGGETGQELARHLQAEKLSANVVPLREPTRVNVIVTTKAGRQMRFNPAGPELSRSEWNEILRRVRSGLSRLGPNGGLLILSGSLPRGVPVDAYQKLIRHAREHGVRVLLDCDGAPFAAAIKAQPFLVKPNEHELARWFGKALRGRKQMLSAARKLSEQTRGWVFVSRGGQEALLVHADGKEMLSANPPRVKPLNTVGAGDALLAAVAWEVLNGSHPEAWLKSGIATGSRATLLEAGKVKRT